MVRDFLKTYGTQGPLGFPMLDKQALAVDALLKTLPSTKEYEYRKSIHVQAPTELSPGGRSDVSWISTEDVDRQRDVVLARGMSDEHFKLNPVVTLQHRYDLPPVGRSLWRKRVKDGPRQVIKAKTLYPARPESWSTGTDWPPDVAFPLVQAGLLGGKSIGFLPTRVRPPTEAEMTSRMSGWSKPTAMTTMPIATRPHTRPKYSRFSEAPRAYAVLMTSAASRLV